MSSVSKKVLMVACCLAIAATASFLTAGVICWKQVADEFRFYDDN